MKKLLATLMCIIILGIAAVPAAAQNPYRGYRYDTYQTRRYDDHRNETRRNVLTTVGGALGGALIGGLIGGRKGAAIGALAGGGGAAIYTYKLRNRSHYYRY